MYGILFVVTAAHASILGYQADASSILWSQTSAFSATIAYAKVFYDGPGWGYGVLSVRFDGGSLASESCEWVRHFCIRECIVWALKDAATLSTMLCRRQHSPGFNGLTKHTPRGLPCRSLRRGSAAPNSDFIIMATVFGHR